MWNYEIYFLYRDIIFPFSWDYEAWNTRLLRFYILEMWSIKSSLSDKLFSFKYVTCLLIHGFSLLSSISCRDLDKNLAITAWIKLMFVIKYCHQRGFRYKQKYIIWEWWNLICEAAKIDKDTNLPVDPWRRK